MSAELDRIRQVIASGGPTVGPVRLVVVDGPAGSGKSTTADALSRGLDAVVVHADELYEGWSVVADARDRTAAFDALADRVSGWLLAAWDRGIAGEHPVWDWERDRWWESARSVPAAPVVILEGVGMAAAALRARAVAAIWVEHPDPGERLRRVLARDGLDLEDRMTRWQVEETAWFDHDGTRQGCQHHLPT